MSHNELLDLAAQVLAGRRQAIDPSPGTSEAILVALASAHGVVAEHAPPGDLTTTDKRLVLRRLVMWVEPKPVKSRSACAAFGVLGDVAVMMSSGSQA